MKFTSACLAAGLALPLLAAGVSPDDGVNAGPVLEWHPSGGESSHFYQAIESPAGISWTEARENARARGGYLATIASTEENAFVFKLIDNPKYWMTENGLNFGPWLGGFRLPNAARPEVGWVWEHDRTPMAYSNWATSEPDDSPGEDDACLQFMSRSPNPQPTWNNLANQYRIHGFVVEYDRDPAVTPTAFSPAAAPLLVPLLIATTASLILFLAGVWVFLFRRPREEEVDENTKSS